MAEWRRPNDGVSRSTLRSLRTYLSLDSIFGLNIACHRQRMPTQRPTIMIKALYAYAVPSLLADPIPSLFSERITVHRRLELQYWHQLCKISDRRPFGVIKQTVHSGLSGNRFNWVNGSKTWNVFYLQRNQALRTLAPWGLGAFKMFLTQAPEEISTAFLLRGWAFIHQISHTRYIQRISS